MRITIILSILLMALSSNAQRSPLSRDGAALSERTKTLVAKIEKVNELMDYAVYESWERPAQYDNFVALQKKATKRELLTLTDHPNGVVRCYAFWALSYDTTADLLPIVLAHISDTASVRTQFGCIGSRRMVGDLFIEIVTPQYIDERSKKLTAAEMSYLDSILIYTPNVLTKREGAIIRARPTENFYRKMRTPEEEHNGVALVALAKYKREQDIPLILNYKDEDEYSPHFFTFRAISVFPHAAFLPLLRTSLYESLGETSYSNEWREMYNAIAAYKNDSAVALLRSPFTQVKYANMHPYHMRFLFGAVQEYYTPLYDDILWDMWANEKMVNGKIYAWLAAKDPQRALQLAQQTIENAEDHHLTDLDDEPSGSVQSIMLDAIMLQDKDKGIALINKNLREIHVHLFPFFADQALKTKDSSFVTSLLVRLEKEDNGHIYLKATEVLLAYHDKDINRRIVAAAAKNRYITNDWAGKRFAALLKQNGITGK